MADGYHVYASDARYDLVPTDSTNNPSKNYDHAWGVPIVQSLIESLFAMYPNRTFNIAGFSLGPTIIRDALRRMMNKGENPFARIHALHFASGGHHGVSTYAKECSSETNPVVPGMAGAAACQLGDRTNYVLTPFEAPLNGPGGVDGSRTTRRGTRPAATATRPTVRRASADATRSSTPPSSLRTRRTAPCSTSSCRRPRRVCMARTT